MTSGLVIVLILVVWLFVLAPWLLRSQRPMSHTGEGFDETRVLFEGDSGQVKSRRPRMTEEQMRRVKHASSHTDADDDYELVTADVEEDDILLDDVPTVHSTELAARAEEAAEADKAEEVVRDDDAIDGEVVADTDSADEQSEEASEAGIARRIPHPTDEADDEAEGTGEAAAEDNEDDTEVAAYHLDETYTSPVDLFYPGVDDSDSASAHANEPAEDDVPKDGVEAAATDDGEDPLIINEPVAEEAENPVSAQPATAVKVENTKEADLTEEELAFAMRRRGRGGWDPEADKRASADRYQRRRRTLLGLAIAVVVSLFIGFIAGGAAWFVPAVALGITGLYLFALRSQVRQENDLRQRRIRQLRRARLGVRNAHDDELAIPRQLRRPGAVVLEADDESPDFDHLPIYTRHDDGNFDGPRHRKAEQRDDLAARRVG